MKELDLKGRRLYNYQQGDIIYYLTDIHSDETSVGVVASSKKNYVTISPEKTISKTMIFGVTEKPEFLTSVLHKAEVRK